MDLDPDVLEHLADLPSSLEALRDALAVLGDQGGPRPWLPPVPEHDEKNHRIWAQVVEALIPHVLDGPLIPRIAALRVLVLCPISEAGLLAARVLDDLTAAARAIDVISRSGMHTARETLEPLLAHSDGLVRFKAAAALGVVGDPLAIPALRALFSTEEDEPLVLRWAARSIGELGGEDERVFLEAQVAAQSSAAVREGLREGLEALGVDRDDLHPAPDVMGTARAAFGGDPSALEGLLDDYCDPERGQPARIVLSGLPEAQLGHLADLIRSGPAQRRFAAADVAGWRGVSSARGALEELSEDASASLAFVALMGLARLGDEKKAASLARAWTSDFTATARTEAMAQLAWCNVPVPLLALRALLFDPCAMVLPTAVELLVREPSPETEELLAEALQLEWRRLQGETAPRDPAEHGRFVMHKSRIGPLVRSGAPRRSVLPEAYRPAAVELETEGFSTPSVVASHFLLHALPFFDAQRGHAELRRWLEAGPALLRFDALKLIGLGGGAVPPALEADPDPRVRALAIALR